MTTTIKTTKIELIDAGTTTFLDIFVDGAVVGEAMLTRYHDEDCNYHDEDCEIKYNHLERFDIDEDPIGKGYGTEAIKLMRKFYGRIVVAPDSEGSRRYFERIGGLVVDTTGDKEECLLDVGFGVYEFC